MNHPTGWPWQAADGNVLLKLAGYAKTNPVVANSLGYFYFQTQLRFISQTVIRRPG